MAISFLFPLLLAVGLLAGCGDDDDSASPGDPSTAGGSGGSGGAAGSGGASGQGGSAGSAGASGAAGGQAGAAGAAGTGGEGGSAGSAGSAGAAGSDAGSAGAAGEGASGSAGDAGAAGAAGEGGAGGSAGSEPKAQARVAQLTTSHSTPMDLCLEYAEGGAVVGPLLKGALDEGLLPGQISRFVDVPPGKVSKVRLLTPPAACSASTETLAVDLTLAADSASTLVVMDEVSPQQTTKKAVKMFTTATQPVEGKAHIEFINAIPDATIDVVSVSPGGALGDVFPGVAPGTAGKGVNRTPTSSFQMALGASPLDSLDKARLVFQPTLLANATVWTLFSTGYLGPTATVPPSVVLCTETAPPFGGLSSCAPLPPAGAQLRLAHLSPDAPAVDLCVQYEGSDNFVGPLLSPVLPDGIAYSQVSQYIEAPAGKVSKMRLIAPDKTSCSEGIATLDVSATLKPGQRTTAAVLGETAAGAPNPLSIAAYATPLAGVPAKTHLDFIHASPGTAAVDLKIVKPDGSLDALFSAVDYAAKAPGAAVDPASVTLALGASPLNTKASAALLLKPTDLAVNTALTLFAIGNLDDDPKPLSALACVETAAPVDGLSVCSVLAEGPLAPQPEAAE